MPPMPALKRYGCFSVNDSGVPHNSCDYTTLMIVNGLGFHSAIFEKLFSFLGNMNIRLVTANRPGYPGAIPLTDKEQMQLRDIAAAAEQDLKSAASALVDYSKANAIKTHDFLMDFISRENIPIDGGIVLVGWSFGATAVLGFLAHANSFSSKEFDLRPYIKHTVFYDAPACFLGYSPPAGLTNPNPLLNPSLTFGEALKIFPHWVSAYYALNDDPSKLGYEELEHPPPTILSMDPLDLQRCLEIDPMLPGGSDQQFMQLGIRLGLFSYLKAAAIDISKDSEQDLQAVNRWNDVEIKYIWCDQSVWEMTWAAYCLQIELDSNKKAGRLSRKVEMVRLRGGSHFYHWDRPEVILNALLSGVNL